MGMQFNDRLAQELTTYGTLVHQSSFEYSLGKGNIFLIKSENVIGKKRMPQPIKRIKCPSSLSS